jgi:2,4-dienoyl-CoA reductase-like NADH-dependent reductase (Old Yellow Enzyme family)
MTIESGSSLCGGQDKIDVLIIAVLIMDQILYDVTVASPSSPPTTRRAPGLFDPGEIGGVPLRNRFVRSAVSETLADDRGVIRNPEYRDFYERLAAGGSGLLFTGHCFVERRGRYSPGMTGLVSAEHAAAFGSVIDAVHGHGARIFAQLNHAGSQSRVPDVQPIAPSVVDNAQTGRKPAEASAADIREVIEAYRSAAGFARDAGFDGVHLHAGHGYLLSSFLSPYSNRRTDEWGGPLENRNRLIREVVAAVRDGSGDLPVTVKLGMRDFVDGGLELDDAIVTAQALVEGGVAALEVSAGITSSKIETVQTYTAVTRRRAAEDKLVHRLFASTRPQGYFVAEARSLKRAVSCPVIVVGGLRTVGYMEAVLREGAADFVSLGRPLIREPDLPNKIRDGRRGLVECTSCNICMMHEGVHPLRCWRTSSKLLAEHAYHRLSGKLMY